MNIEKNCQACGAIIKGRSDKKFCDDQCRSRYNYAQNLQRGIGNVKFVRDVNAVLKKNRNILKALSTEGKTKILKQTLIAKGFNFNYHTDIQNLHEYSRHFFCYEMGYLNISNTEVLVLKKEIDKEVDGSV